MYMYIYSTYINVQHRLSLYQDFLSVGDVIASPDVLDVVEHEVASQRVGPVAGQNLVESTSLAVDALAHLKTDNPHALYLILCSNTFLQLTTWPSALLPESAPL